MARDDDTAPRQRRQRIKLRLLKHPVKHDATIIWWAADGQSFTVQFDGPLPDTLLYVYSDSFVTDQQPERRTDGRVSQPSADAQLWEVL